MGGNTTSTTTSSSPPSSVTATPAPTQPYTHPHLHRITFLPRPRPPLQPGSTGAPQQLHNNNPPDKPPDPLAKPLEEDIEDPGDSYSYIGFDKSHPDLDHCYPVMEGIRIGEKRDSITSLKKQQQQQLELLGVTGESQPMQQGKKYGRKDGKRPKPSKARCRHCQEMFTDSVNARGSCEYAPDCVRTAVDTLTCITCAQCMLYHCMADAEGDFAPHPCECVGPGGAGTDEACGRRWLGLTLLSLLVPCLWCYLPLRACHRCAVGCGLCGGRHQAS
ncbi:sprouty-related, EVH1 domain-containing protein 2-like [Oratosquilla oratoria]|uniref:sprouty-related, EVH1 domain-containing protein 2-like n=1 Tax=Oratosquilla oratoria TaxID=337810 RepID=UPI003F767276